MTSVTFQHRRIGAWFDYAPGVTFKPVRWRWNVTGGPRSAAIEAEGSAQELANLLQWIGYGVRIMGDFGAPVWWGKIARVTVDIDGLPWTADVEEMYNRVAVAYTTIALGQSRTGERATTDWSENAASIAEYGRREMLDSIGNTTSAHAEARRDQRLARRAYPRLKPDLRAGGSQNATAMIECVGWWDTLEWVYANVPTSLVLAYQTIGAVTQKIGSTADSVKSLAESFDTGGSAWNLQQAAIYVGKTGLPDAGLTVSIAENPDDATPGSSLASGTIAAADIPDTPGWVVVTFSAPYLTTAGATYFLVVDFGGTLDAANCYTVTLDGSMGYAAGVLRQRVGSTWGAGPAADMPFRLYTNEVIENADQIRAMLVDNGQFLKKVHLSLTTGITTESFRNGDKLAIDEIEQLLETGTTAGKRLLATVNADQSVSIFVEPNDDGKHFIGADGNFYQGQALLDPQSCPCGFWARTAGIRPLNLGTGNLSEAESVFIEGAEYDAETGRVIGETDDEHDLIDLGDQYG